MKTQNLKLILSFLTAALMLGAFAITGTAQTSAFTYQGRFTDASVAQPTNGTYNMQFALFDAVSGGSQIGATVMIPAVQVVNGIFTVQLDYTAASFDGTARFLQITVGNTVLNPRQEITSAPFAIAARKALLASDSNKLGGIDADQYVTGQVVRSVNNLSNNVTLAAGNNITITPSGNTLTIASTGGGGSGINNQTNVQTAANFNIDGTGSANIFNATTQFNLGGSRFLSGGGGNVFAGVSAGAANTTGGDNTFVGARTGLTNAAGNNNSFFGTDAGRSNTADNNSFFGRSAGYDTIGGASNSFFGIDSGRFNVAGSNNAFYGRLSGANSKADNNAFFGFQSGAQTTTGGGNLFLGYNAGLNNTTGANNTSIGSNSNFGANNLSFATTIGAGSVVSTSNTIVLGRSDGSDTVRIFGLGTSGSTLLCRNASNQISTCASGAGNGDYIQNSTVQQPTANFNISGNGTLGGTVSANIVNTLTNFQIGSVTVLSTPNGSSVVVGQDSNHPFTAPGNSFFGFQAGKANTTGAANTFLGQRAGKQNTVGLGNIFAGADAGKENTEGNYNAFFGTSAGTVNSTGSANSFFGTNAGASNVDGSENSFFGFQAGTYNNNGTRNSFFGFRAGYTSPAANDNSFFGYEAGLNVSFGTNNSFFGSLAGINTNSGGDNSFFGKEAGFSNAGGFRNTFIGSQAGRTNTVRSENTYIGYLATGGDGNQNTSVGGFALGSLSNNTSIGYNARAYGGSNVALGSNTQIRDFNSPAVNNSTAIGFGAVVTTSNTIVLGTNADTVKLPNDLSVADTTNLNLLNVAGKVVLQSIKPQLDGEYRLCTNLQAIIYRCNNQSSFSAQDGENVKSNPINTALVDSVKEQKIQIESQAEEIKRQSELLKQQQSTIEALKQIVCSMNPAAKICGK